MADPARYRYMDTAGRRSPPLYNPARSSMPVTSAPYSSLYSGDLHAMSNSHHEGLSRPAADDYRTSAAPVTTSPYHTRKDPLSRSTSVNDGPRVHRPADQNPKRPVIVATKHHQLSPRSGSPSRDPYRSSEDGPYYAEPASSIPRSRAPGHAPSTTSTTTALDEEEYRRLKERTHHDRLGNRGADPYRPTRTGPHYPVHGQRSHTFDYDGDGYEYTKPSDLARYDLDHDQRRKPRRESLDRYYRPTVSISTDMARPFDPPDRRVRGPPPTTRGLDKITWPATAAGGIYDGAGSRMPSAPLPPDARRPNLLDPPGSPREDHRGGPRPLSMIQDDPNRNGHSNHHPTHHDDYYYDDIMSPQRDHGFFQDDRVTARGFGILVDPDEVEDHRRPPDRVCRDDRRERREPVQRRYEVREPRRRPDDDMEIVRHDYDDRDYRRRRDHDRPAENGVGHDRKGRISDDEDDEDYEVRKDHRGKADDYEVKKDSRGKVANGLGLAAAAIGLGAAGRGKDDRGEDRSSPRRKKEDADADRRHDDAESRSKPSKKEPLLGDEEFEIVEHPRDRAESPRTSTEPEVRESKNGGTAAPSSPQDKDAPAADEGKVKPRRRVRDSSFNPNDTAALAEMKARLAEVKPKDTSPTKEDSPERKSSPSDKADKPDSDPAPSPKDDGKSRDLTIVPAREERQVRVVPPPKEPEKKPIKGILKQPRAQFPEEQNPVREGVAPHKDDKTKADIQPGARWTKISRKMVNPEALKIGKERFEVRDDFVIVLRVLSKEEVHAYAAATATLRERRKKEYDREREARGAKNGAEERDSGEEDEEDQEEEDKKRRHKQQRKGREEEEERGKREDRDKRERDRDDRDKREREKEDKEKKEREREDRDKRERERERERRSRHARAESEDEEEEGYERRRGHRG